MGTGASKDPTVGVQLNPRVQYAGDLARQEGKVGTLLFILHYAYVRGYGLRVLTSE